MTPLPQNPRVVITITPSGQFIGAKTNVDPELQIEVVTVRGSQEARENSPELPFAVDVH
jgi:hypothetical protein